MQQEISNSERVRNSIPIRCPINDLGFGLFGLGIASSVSQHNHVSYRAREVKSENTLEKLYKTQEVVNIHHTRFLTDNAPSTESEQSSGLINIWHPTGIHEGFPEHVSNKIGWTHFETDNLKPIEIAHLSQLKTIIVSSHWGKEVLQRNFDRARVSTPNIAVIPGPAIPLVPGNTYKTSIKAADIIQNIKKKFDLKGILVSSGKWEIRKNHPEIIQAITALEMPINLIGLWDNPFTGGTLEPIKYLIDSGWELELQGEIEDKQVPIFKNKHGARVFVFPRFESHIFITSIFKYCDGYIAVSSGEGWDMPAVEAMSLCTPTLLSKNTAHLEYLAVPEWEVPCQEVPAIDGRWFHGEGNWYKPVQSQFVEKLYWFWNDTCREHNVQTIIRAKWQQEKLATLCNSEKLSEKLQELL